MNKEQGYKFLSKINKLSGLFLLEQKLIALGKCWGNLMMACLEINHQVITHPRKKIFVIFKTAHKMKIVINIFLAQNFPPNVKFLVYYLLNLYTCSV